MPDERELEGSRAPFLEHLEELRTRLWRSVIGVVFAAVFCFLVHDEIFAFLAEPLRLALDNHGLEPRMVYRSPAGAFVFHLKTALLGGIFFGIPVIMHQAWQFIAPGLYRNERMYTLPFVVLSSVCFIGGGTFAYQFVMPQAFDFLVGYTIEGSGMHLVPDIAVEDYLGFATKLLLAFGLVFELPVATGFFAAIGILDHVMLIRFWRWAVVLSFVLGAMLTPPDYITQIMLAIPLMILYGISIGVAYVISNRRLSKDDEEESSDETLPVVTDGE